jgi:hypothetical protein
MGLRRIDYVPVTSSVWPTRRRVGVGATSRLSCRSYPSPRPSPSRGEGDFFFCPVPQLMQFGSSLPLVDGPVDVATMPAHQSHPLA